MAVKYKTNGTWYDISSSSNNAVDAVENENLNPVTSNAVYDALNSLITVPTTAPGEGQQRVYRIGDIQIIVGLTRAIGNISSTSNKVTYTVPFKFSPSVHATNDANMGSPIFIGWQNASGFTCGTSTQFDTGNECNGVFEWVAIGVAAN